MNADDIKKARDLIARATPGPWMVDDGMNYVTTKKGIPFQHVLAAGHDNPCRGQGICNTSHHDEIELCGEIVSEARPGKMEDAAFIASARTLLPQALDALEAAQAKLDAVRDWLKPIANGRRQFSGWHTVEEELCDVVRFLEEPAAPSKR